MSHFMKIHWVVVTCIQMDWWTDRRDEVNNCFSQLCKCT